MTSHGQRIEGALPLATIGRGSTREAPIAKARIATPPEFAGMPPVNPSDSERPIQPDWKGSEGLAGDVRYYGQWVRRQALKRIGHLYPSVTLPPERGGGEA